MHPLISRKLSHEIRLLKNVLILRTVWSADDVLRSVNICVYVKCIWVYASVCTCTIIHAKLCRGKWYVDSIQTVQYFTNVHNRGGLLFCFLLFSLNTKPQQKGYNLPNKHWGKEKIKSYSQKSTAIHCPYDDGKPVFSGGNQLYQDLQQKNDNPI